VKVTWHLDHKDRTRVTVEIGGEECVISEPSAMQLRDGLTTALDEIWRYRTGEEPKKP
jgi:hypothetical protein